MDAGRHSRPDWDQPTAEHLRLSEVERPEEVAAAQNALDVHVMSGATGRCLKCDVFSPCPAREQALKVMTSYMWLPTRQPGATKPHLIGAKQIA